MWGRVSKKAVKRGFDFSFLGKALIQIAREKAPNAEALEVLFVTSSDFDVRGLDAIAEKCRVVAHDLRHRIWAEKGFDIDCLYGGHCGICGDKETCDGVRKIAAERKKQRVND